MSNRVLRQLICSDQCLLGMKQSVLILFVLLSIASCKEEVTEGCIDPSKVDTESACITLYDPVSGCDNVTYSNSCFAEKIHVS